MPSPVPNLAPGIPDLAPVEAGAPPRSTAFDDPYFSSEDGLSEAETVFISGCGLPERWAVAGQFVVGELGFGTGLNFLALWRLWRAEGPKDGWLHFVSVEGFPLDRDQARAALAPFHALGDLREELLAAWPPRIKGVHRRVFPADRITLTIAHLPVSEALEQLDLAADAWFLDGFAPARNPDMWTPDVLAAVARASRPGARAATFTVAGDVRRGLETAGFAVEKKPGHGRKRERLEARLVRAPEPAPTGMPTSRAAASEGPTLIIGAGVAGAALAAALAKRGREPILLDAGAAPGAGASGVPAGLVAPRLDLDDRPEARLHRCAYAFALEAYRGSDAFRPTGVLRAALDSDGAERLSRLAASRVLPPEMARAAEDGGLLLDQAGVLDPAAWIAETLAGPWPAGPDVRLDVSVASLGLSEGVWIARDDAGRPIAEAPTCVVAAGTALARFAPTSFVPIAASRGQLSIAPLSGPAPGRAASWGGYHAPLTDGRLAFGATFDNVDPDTTLRPDAASEARNLESLRAFDPDLAARVDIDRARSFVGLRATTPDRLPILGPAVDAAAFETKLRAQLARRRGSVDASAIVEAEARLPGLYLFGGLGSRGFTLAPLLAEALAAEICGEPGALERGAAAALHPARFLARRLRRER